MKGKPVSICVWTLCTGKRMKPDTPGSVNQVGVSCSQPPQKLQVFFVWSLSSTSVISFLWPFNSSFNSFFKAARASLFP